jgi:hypothetical protein
MVTDESSWLSATWPRLPLMSGRQPERTLSCMPPSRGHQFAGHSSGGRCPSRRGRSYCCRQQTGDSLPDDTHMPQPCREGFGAGTFRLRSLSAEPERRQAGLGHGGHGVRRTFGSGRPEVEGRSAQAQTGSPSACQGLEGIAVPSVGSLICLGPGNELRIEGGEDKPVISLQEVQLVTLSQMVVLDHGLGERYTEAVANTAGVGPQLRDDWA